MARPVNNRDTYMQMLLKNIPSELIAAYVAILAAVASFGAPTWAQWVAFGVTLVSVPIWLIFAQKVRFWLQIVLSTVGFCVWDMSLVGGAFQSISGFEPGIGAFILLLFTLLIAPGVSWIMKSQMPASS